MRGRAGGQGVGGRERVSVVKDLLLEEEVEASMR